MKEVESQTDLRGVKPRFLLVESTLSLHVEHEVTAVHKLYDKEQSASNNIIIIIIIINEYD